MGRKPQFYKIPISQFCIEKIKNRYQKGGQKLIVDAERNRRTLEKPASHVPWFGGGASSKSTKQVPKTASNATKRHQNGSQNRCKIDKKSSWRRGGVRGAFREAKRRKYS